MNFPRRIQCEPGVPIAIVGNLESIWVLLIDVNM